MSVLRFFSVLLPLWFFGTASGKVLPAGQGTFQQQLPDNSLKNSELNGFGFKGITRLVKPSIPISDCVFTTSQSGSFIYEATSDEPTVCGVYFFSEPDKRVELSFLSFDVPCEQDGLVSFVDGWEMNGQVFPSELDHPLPINERVDEFCGKRVSRTFISSQNAAMIQYRIPAKGKGFTVFVRYRKYPMPCNILVNSEVDAYTLRNYGRRLNCTVTAIFPSAVRVLTLDVGGKRTRSTNHQIETGTVHNCDQRGLMDQVQIGGNSGLDTTKIEVLESICGVDSKPEMGTKIIGCGLTSVRLISSGFFDNSVTVMVRQAIEDEIMESNLICGL